MCAGAVVLSRVGRLVYGASTTRPAPSGTLWDVIRDRRLNHRPEVIGVLASKSTALLEEFFTEDR